MGVTRRFTKALFRNQNHDECVCERLAACPSPQQDGSGESSVSASGSLQSDGVLLLSPDSKNGQVLRLVVVS